MSGKDLEGHFAIEPGVQGAVDLPERSDSDSFDQRQVSPLLRVRGTHRRVRIFAVDVGHARKRPGAR